MNIRTAADVNFTSGWNTLIAQIPAGILTVLAAAGIAVIVIYVWKWAWKKRQGNGGGGMQGFPWIALAIGAVLAGPKITIPVILAIAGKLVDIIITLTEYVTKLL